jgi:adenylate kinase
MFNNIVFVGGIHGVGKSTICKKICSDLGINYLSASEVLKWKQIKPDHQDKKVSDIPYTQDRLIMGLADIVKSDEFYLLDGHFCLLDQNGAVYNVPEETFQAINPLSLNVILGDAEEIKMRLEERDYLPYSISLLQEMQDNEVKYSKSLSDFLNRPLFFGSPTEYTEISKNVEIILKKQV